MLVALSAAACARRQAPLWVAHSPACRSFVSPDTARVYETAQVDRPAQPVRGVPVLASGLPRAVDWAAAVELVVDTTGRVEPCSVRPLTQTHGGLASDLVGQVGGLRFQPALIGGRKVRQRMQYRMAGTA
jgi:hypothetical protein